MSGMGQFFFWVFVSLCVAFTGCVYSAWVWQTKEKFERKWDKRRNQKLTLFAFVTTSPWWLIAIFLNFSTPGLILSAIAHAASLLLCVTTWGIDLKEAFRGR